MGKFKEKVSIYQILGLEQLVINRKANFKVLEKLKVKMKCIS